jgi:hypothetical protein
VLYGEPGQQETGSISPLCILALQHAGAWIAHLGQTDSARELPNTNTKKGEGSRTGLWKSAPPQRKSEIGTFSSPCLESGPEAVGGEATAAHAIEDP